MSLIMQKKVKCRAYRHLYNCISDNCVYTFIWCAVFVTVTFDMQVKGSYTCTSYMYVHVDSA